MSVKRTWTIEAEDADGKPTWYRLHATDKGGSPKLVASTDSLRDITELIRTCESLGAVLTLND